MYCIERYTCSRMYVCAVNVVWQGNSKYTGKFTKFIPDKGLQCTYDDGDIRYYNVLVQQGSEKLFSYNRGHVSDVHWIYIIERPRPLQQEKGGSTPATTTTTN